MLGDLYSYSEPPRATGNDVQTIPPSLQPAAKCDPPSVRGMGVEPPILQRHTPSDSSLDFDAFVGDVRDHEWKRAPAIDSFESRAAQAISGASTTGSIATSNANENQRARGLDASIMQQLHPPTYTCDEAWIALPPLPRGPRRGPGVCAVTREVGGKKNTIFVAGGWDGKHALNVILSIV
eukprot:gene8693-25515_t